MAEYRISKEECEKNIRGVCEGCGGKLTAMETVDNAWNLTHWQGCEHCQCFRSGVEEKIFRIARTLVESGEMIPYSHMRKADYDKTPEALAYYYDCQTAGLSRQIARIDFLLNNAKYETRGE